MKNMDALETFVYISDKSVNLFRFKLEADPGIFQAINSK